MLPACAESTSPRADGGAATCLLNDKDAGEAMPPDAGGAGSAPTSGLGMAGRDEGAAVSLRFVLRNFCEMNKLWTRMQRNLPHSDARDVVRTVRLPLLGMAGSAARLVCRRMRVS